MDGIVKEKGHQHTLSVHLYTNHDCPWAHRAHIALKELGIPYEETIIDLDTPREPWYLKVNPRGLVPSIKVSSDSFKDEIVTESGVIVHFLADSQHSHLFPSPSSSASALLFRARVNFFTDTWNSKIAPLTAPILRLDDSSEKEARCKELAQTIGKEIEPLLEGANPFFAGSQSMTLAEVLTAPFLIRLYAMSNDVLLPKMLKAEFDKLPNFSSWGNHVMKQASVTSIFNADRVTSRTAQRVAKLKAEASKN